jgi:glycosyltransferase involved in cell wall biosynthesis
MKILVLSPSAKKRGGVQRYSSCFVRALRELLGEDKVCMLEVSECAGQDGLKRLPAKAKGWFAFQALLTACSWRADVMIATHIGLAPLAQVVSKLLYRPYWVIAYGIEVWGSLTGWKRVALRRADKVLSVSAFTRQRLVQRHQVPMERIVILPGTLDAALLNIAPDSKRVKGQLGDRRAILTVGRLAASERYKGHDIVLQAMPKVLKKVPKACYLIVGDGDDRGRLEALAEQLGVREQAYFFGAVNDAELVACYQMCDVFAMPARTILDDEDPKGEGFGIVFLEAMAFGKPVIGPNYGAPTEFIRHGEHGFLVNPDDPNEVAEAIITLLTQPGLAFQMGETARQWVLSEFSYERFKEKLLKILLKQPRCAS